MSLGCYKCDSEFLQMCHSVVIHMTLGCNKCVAKIFQICHDGVTNVIVRFYKCFYKHVINVSLGLYELVTVKYYYGWHNEFVGS